jgi:hypothetical protein
MHQIWSFSLSVRPDRLLEVRYEDLLARPVEPFERVIRFLEIDDDDGRLLDKISRRAPADLKQDNCDKWRTLMTPRQVARFDRIAWDCLQHYGYETSVAEPAAPSVVSSWFWECDNKVRKLLRSDYLSDNVYKARLRIRELLTARLPG